MVWVIVAVLVVVAVLLMVAERGEAAGGFVLEFKGELPPTGWLAQYGQGACTLVAAGLMLLLDVRRLGHNLQPGILLLIVVFGTSIICTILKRIFGRVRPGRDDAGNFWGRRGGMPIPGESFPSSHTHRRWR